MMKKLEQLSGKTAQNEEAIVSFDAYRRTINQEILTLKQRTRTR